jgi:hypothetical protein
MASSNQATGRQYWNLGRGFASADPERQGEVIGFVRSRGIETSAPARQAGKPAAQPARRDWMRVQADYESSNFEGSSSRRWR